MLNESPKKQSQKPTSSRRSFTVSLVLHIILLFILLVGHKKQKSKPKEEWIEIVTLPPENKAQGVEEKEISQEPRVKREDKNKIVQTEILQETKKEDPNAFLGEKTQTLEDQKVKTGDTSEPARGERIKQTAKRHGTPEKSESGPQKLTLDKIGLALPNPLKTKEEIQKAGIESNVAGQAASVHDYVPGVKEGERTLLNTKEYKYFSYFQRIRKQLEINWRPILQDKLQRFFEAGRQLSSNKDHITEVLVYLNSEGKIIQVKILSESGTRDLDESAINAFNKAGPFPNPPKGLIETDGTVKVRWEFVLRT